MAEILEFLGTRTRVPTPCCGGCRSLPSQDLPPTDPHGPGRSTQGNPLESLPSLQEAKDLIKEWFPEWEEWPDMVEKGWDDLAASMGHTAGAVDLAVDPLRIGTLLGEQMGIVGEEDGP